MRIFRKKKVEKTCSCCEDNENSKININLENDGKIKILGSGCAKCMKLEESTRSALKDLNISCDIEHITNFSEIASYGVMSTPALVFDNKVVSYGKVLSEKEIKKILEKLI